MACLVYGFVVGGFWCVGGERWWGSGVFWSFRGFMAVLGMNTGTGWDARGGVGR